MNKNKEMEKEKLLTFFKEKNELVNQNKAFTSFDLECVNSFNFTISNTRDSDGCSIQIESLENVIDAVKKYYSGTKVNYIHYLEYSFNFSDRSKMYVTPVLLTN